MIPQLAPVNADKFVMDARKLRVWDGFLANDGRVYASREEAERLGGGCTLRG